MCMWLYHLLKSYFLALFSNEANAPSAFSAYFPSLYLSNLGLIQKREAIFHHFECIREGLLRIWRDIPPLAVDLWLETKRKRIISHFQDGEIDCWPLECPPCSDSRHSRPDCCPKCCPNGDLWSAGCADCRCQVSLLVNKVASVRQTSRFFNSSPPLLA